MDRHLREESDRFPALQGLANHIHMLTGSRYLAGHFEHQLLRSLLWSRYGKMTQVTPRFMPSWSWVSLRGSSRGSGPTDIVDKDDLFELCAEYLEATQVPRRRENSHQSSEERWRLHIRGYLVKLGGKKGHMLKSKRAGYNDDEYDLEYKAVLPFKQEAGGNSADSEDGPDVTDQDLDIQILPDRPSELQNMFPQALDCNISGWSVRTGLEDSFVFLLPLGTSFSSDWGRKLRGLLVEAVDIKGRICRRLGTFESEFGSGFNFTHEVLLAGLFGDMEQSELFLE